MEAAWFTPEQGRELWQDYLRRKQLPAQQTQSFPQRRILDEPSPHRAFVYNTESEIIPAYACMRVVGTRNINNVTAIDVEKPSSLDGEFLFNGPYPIAAVSETNTGVGWAYRFGVVIMLGDEPTEPGVQYQPIIGSWEIEEGPGPFVVYGDHRANENTDDRALVGRFAGGGSGATTILFEIVRVLRGVGLNCNAMECEVLNVSCGGSGVAVGDLVAVYDERGCVFNSPEHLLYGRRGYAIQMKNFDYRMHDVLQFEAGTEDIAAPTGACRWAAQNLCCVEEED